MQITMFAIMVATFGLAALVAQSRERSETLVLSEDPVRVGHLNVRFPSGWATDSANGESPTTLPAIATAEERRDVRMGGRAISIVQYAQPSGRSTDHVLRRYLQKVAGEAGNAKPITVLGQPGLLLRFTSVQPIPNHPFGAEAEIPGWLVVGVVPRAGDDGQDLGVVVHLEGYATQGPAGERIVRQLADGLSVITPGSSTRESAGK